MSQTAAEPLAAARRQDLPLDSLRRSLQLGPGEERAAASALPPCGCLARLLSLQIRLRGLMKAKRGGGAEGLTCRPPCKAPPLRLWDALQTLLAGRRKKVADHRLTDGHVPFLYIYFFYRAALRRSA